MSFSVLFFFFVFRRAKKKKKTLVRNRPVFFLFLSLFSFSLSLVVFVSDTARESTLSSDVGDGLIQRSKSEGNRRL